MKNNSSGNDKERAVKLAITQIEKQFGRGSIMMLGDDSVKVDTESIPTGSLALDNALGIGG
ncbi:MAG: DNA recombination/repair protein RecA, partial [Candidatus Latescibacteria bacterium]|nr:DNA recombination/repair protein RecA [Candidatus Latescibacterota bacterium]